MFNLRILHKYRSCFVAVVAAVAILFSCSSTIAADAVAEFYKGKTIRIIVAVEAGGVHDTYTRLLLPFLEEHTPGQPNYLIQNMGGAGGTVAANYLYQVAPRDGTAIGMLLQDAATAPLLNSTGTKYKFKEFQFLAGAEINSGCPCCCEINRRKSSR